MTSHAQRLLTAAVLALVLGLLLVAAPPLLMAAALLLVSWVALYEFWSLFWKGWTWLKGAGLLLSVFIIWSLPLGWTLGAVIVACFWVLGLIYLGHASKQQALSLTDTGLVLTGLVYIPGSLQFVLHMQRAELLLVLLAVFTSDTAAYYSGSLWGQRKLWPRISPKKTWMGSLGGLLSCILVCLIVGSIWGEAGGLVWMGVGVILNLAAQAGDLMESAFKRQLGVKDSGWILPGHGGLLDRIDSLLLAIPVYMAMRTMYPLFM